MAEYKVIQNYQGLKPGTLVSFEENELSEVLRRGIKGGLLVEVKPAQKVVEVEEVKVDGSDFDENA